MKTFSPVLALFLATAALAAPAKKPLVFDHLALGNVVRILSARSSAPVTITAHATSPITGDFSHFSLREGLDEAAAQAGLEVVALGKTNAAGFLLRVPKAVAAPKVAVLPPAVDRRAELLKQREALRQSEAALAASANSPTP